jgi:hypothetical protein
MNDIRKTIWSFKQNKPSLIVKDICEKYPEVNKDFIYEVLLNRGVFKWFSVRRKLIKLKNKWKIDITKLNRKKTEQEKGFLKAIEKCRKEVRELCHSDRFIAPDFDKDSNIFLKKILEKITKENK